jgi:ribosomal protein S18 acetylase RimI-like enzyme
MLAIRTATSADTDEVVGVGRAAWPVTFAAVTGLRYVEEGLARWWTDQSVRPAIDAGHVLVAERAGRVVGMALVRPDGRATHLDRLYVLPEEQGAGVGSALLDEVRQRASIQPIRLTVLADNQPARRFYARHGFRAKARIPDSLGGPDQVVMHLS